MTALQHNKAFTPSGFFALRTPLLPFDALLAWSEGLEAAAALDDPRRLEAALAADRARLRARLRTMVVCPEVRDALFVASPDLDASFETWIREPESERGQRVERTLVRYMARMAGRATPFGLFAGASVGRLGAETRLAIAARARYQRHTRLDMDYLFALTEALGRDSSLRQVLHYRPNSSLYHAAGRVRYAEARLNGKERSYHLVAVDDTDYLAATLQRAQGGASAAALAAALVDDEVTQEEAEAYIDALIASQILVPALDLAVTGPEPIHPLVEQLREHGETAPLAAGLHQVCQELAVMDAEGLGIPPERYRAVVPLLEGLPVQVELSRLLQVDMVKPAPEATLGRAVLAEIGRGVELLHSLAPSRGDESLRQFCAAFAARYEEREVPLVEALDEEVGIGFGSTAEAAPLLQGLWFKTHGQGSSVPWGARETFLLQKLSAALQGGSHEITLEPHELERLGTQNPLPMPDAFAVMASLAAASETALARGDFYVFLEGAFGPSGARLLGRFCHADATLQQHVEQHLRAEEALRPEAIFAEIVHLPEGRIGNVLARPLLRDYEIPYLGRSSAPAERQIPITDLYIAVRGGRLVLRSARLGREVMPRMSNAHNYAWRSLGIYKFLCALQHQGVTAGLGWDWGPLWNAPFLPRVTVGRLVLSLARWRVGQEELQGLGASHGAARFQAVQRWRAERRLPRWVALGDGDNELPVDLDNVLSVESFVHLVKQRQEATLVELFPAPDLLCARGPEGRFVHELVVPFVRRQDASGPQPAADRQEPGWSALSARQAASPTAPPGLQRTFPPGSEWLYAKLYTGTATADQVLRQVIGPVAREALDCRAADGWFFLRYGDPDWHLRLRLHGAPERLHQEILPVLQQATVPLLDDGRLVRLQLDTYEREVERYGGGVGIVLAEQLFHADSEAVLAIVEMLDGDAGAEARWRLTLRGIEMLLSDLGFDLEAKCALLQSAREAFAREFRVDAPLRRQLGEKFQQDRKSLETLLDPAGDAESPLLPGFLVLQRRSERLAPIVAALRACAQADRLSTPLGELALSYVHMHANRLLRSAQRQQELVLYDFLARFYESQVARARGRGRRAAARVM